MSEFFRSPLSAEALEQLYYLHDGVGIIGPITGAKLKEMIESGAVARGSNVNLVGAPGWTPLDQTGFIAFLKGDGPENRAAPISSVPLSGARSSAPRYAGFWIRLGAYAIDYALTVLLVGLAGAIFAIVSVSFFGADRTEAFLNENSLVVDLIGTVIALGYCGYFCGGPWQATPGKRICGIHIVRTDGKRLDAPFAILRNFGYLASSLPLFFGFLMIFWTDESKALHDMILGTRVVYGKL
ncbi:RDD family protein [Methylocystis heyeri]|uniref:RDD domain-containing protein n=1 Tax=Methylocystis heyeri TaxID=391905 RepID=A0A6B8KD61_9HYPH|nr:RDD family protein [Methylocystis heyeri]QGM44951.1 hypothetical protein H2LOC_004200 [Methylocystis heyeri]